MPGLKRTQDTEDGTPTPSDVGQVASDLDEERPSRRLSPRLDLVVTIWCFGVALFVLRQVFQPLELGSQYYLVSSSA